MLKITQIIILALLCVVYCPFGVSAQDQTEPIDTLLNETPPNLWNLDQYGFTNNLVPSYPPSVYALRIKNIPTDLPLDYNNIVVSYIEMYAKRRRDVAERALKLSQTYFPIYEKILAEEGVPTCIKYLSIVESSLNPNAVSWANAAGLWQFIPSTGKMYGLDEDFFIDDRRDIYLSTRAAAQHLKDLHDIFGDWMMALAAYNCGAGNVNKAIRITGGKTYWEIYNALPAETRGYVPSFIAVAYIMSYADEHNLNAQSSTSLPLTLDTVKVRGPLSIKVVAEQIGMTENELRAINAIFKHGFIPSNNQVFNLALPYDKVNLFRQRETSIYALARTDSSTQQFASKFLGSKYRTDMNLFSEENGISSIVYTVKTNDKFARLAQLFDCSTSDLKRWNNIADNTLRTGQTLTIYVPQSQREYYAKKGETNASESSAAVQSGVISENLRGDYTYYTVRSGDSLLSIASKFPRVSASDIKRINRLKDDRVRPGMKLKIIAG